MHVLIRISAAAAAFLAAPVAAEPKPGDTVEIAGPELRLRDLAGLDGFAAPTRGAAGSRIVAALGDGRSTIVTTRAALAALVRRSVPGLTLDVAEGEGRVTIRRAAAAAAGPGGTCAALAAPADAGAVIGRADVAEVPCDAGTAAAPVRFDRAAGALRAAADLDAGAYLGRIAVPEGVAVGRGAVLTLVSTVGPVTVARPVVAMQTGRGGRRLFVRDEDGQVFAVRLEAGGEAGQ